MTFPAFCGKVLVMKRNDIETILATKRNEIVAAEREAFNAYDASYKARLEAEDLSQKAEAAWLKAHATLEAFEKFSRQFDKEIV